MSELKIPHFAQCYGIAAILYRDSLDSPLRSDNEVSISPVPYLLVVMAL